MQRPNAAPGCGSITLEAVDLANSPSNLDPVRDSYAARVARGFDRLAPFYDLLLAIGSGNAIPRIRRALLAQIPDRKHALILGDGTGRFLCELMATGRVARATCIDSSPAMSTKARARWLRSSRRRAVDAQAVEFRVASLPFAKHEDGPGGPYDLVCTNFFLDLFTDAELGPAFRQIHESLESADALWYDSDFQYPDPRSRPLTGLAARWLVRILYISFALVCGLRARRLPDTNRFFESHGYRALAERNGAGGLLICRIFQKT